jgi:phosphoglycerate dehydrogenase-like enzyme
VQSPFDPTQPFLVGIDYSLSEQAKGICEGPLRGVMEPAGLQTELMPKLPDDMATPEVLSRYDAVLALNLRVPPAALQGVQRLGVIARWGVGYDRIDVPAMSEAGVGLTLTPNAVRRPVAEAIMTLMLALAKNLFVLDRVTRAGQWRESLPGLGMSLEGKVLGSVGCGNIAREMFRMARPFAFSRLIACDPFVAPTLAREVGVELVDMETVFRESDFVAVNSLLNKDTIGLVGEAQLRLMKPSAFLINTARGPIVNEPALVKALQEKWIAGAGLDVFTEEPPRKDHPLFAMPNVVLTPHALPWTDNIGRDNTSEAAENIVEYSRGETPHALLNKEVMKHAGWLARSNALRKS